MLSELFSWWIRQMGDLSAVVLDRVRVAVPDAVLLTAEPGGTRILRRRKGRLEPIGRLADDADPAALRTLVGRHRRKPFVLVLTQPMLLRETTWPAAAQGSLDRVLRYEMDRLTPFAADDVFFSYRLLEVDRARATLRVELAFLPRGWVQPVLDRLGLRGVIPVALEACGPDGVVRRLPLGREDPGKQARERFLGRVMLGICASLAAALVLMPMLRQSLALADVEERIATLRPRVEQAEALRKQIAAGSAGASRIAAAREQAGSVLQMLSLLTDTLPDDTWLTSLTLRQRTLVLEGHSTASNRLIAGMAAEPRLHDPAFAAPVVRDENGAEVFTIRTSYGP